MITRAWSVPAREEVARTRPPGTEPLAAAPHEVGDAFSACMDTAAIDAAGKRSPGR